MSDQGLPPIPWSALVALYGGEISTRGSAKVIALPVPVQRPHAETAEQNADVIAFPAPKWQRNADGKYR